MISLRTGAGVGVGESYLTELHAIRPAALLRPSAPLQAKRT